jgi:aconitate hydratase
MSNSNQVYKKSLQTSAKTYKFFSLKSYAEQNKISIDHLPYSLKVLLENVLRNTEDESEIESLASWKGSKVPVKDINYYPSRVVMQDFTGVPAVVDLASMRDALIEAGGDGSKINPLVPVDLVIDHSVMVDFFGSVNSFEENMKLEFERNRERYRFLRWGQDAFKNFRVVPPGTGIIHQVNLEYLAKVVWTREEDGETLAYPDTLVGTDSHTTMINGLGVLGWGVGGIEAEAAMLGQAVTMLIPEVIGVKLSGSLSEGTTATDLVLTITEQLRKKGVVGKFVEFYGDGLDSLTLADRATISNMAPEYGATCGIFPIDAELINYLKLSNREDETIELVESYAKEQGMWRDENWNPEFVDVLEVNLADIVPSMAGPKRPQDRVLLSEAAEGFQKALKETYKVQDLEKKQPVKQTDYELTHGDVVIAAITSCTNTSNPSVLISAGLLAKKAVELGLEVKPWVKTSFAPGSKVVSEYLIRSGLQPYLDKLGFNLVGYGCTTCIGNSGPLPENIVEAIQSGDLVTANVLSGNRNFEGRISPDSKASYLASPPLVVSYALAGSMHVDILKDPIGKDRQGNDVFLKDLWPSNAEIKASVEKNVTPELFKEKYADVFSGPDAWKEMDAPKSDRYDWDSNSTYIQNPPFFTGFSPEPAAIHSLKGMHSLAILPDSTTTDHISPAGVIPTTSPAGKYLIENGVQPLHFNSFGSRRGNHEVMMRGTFGNIRIKNKMLPGVEGGYTRYKGGEQEAIYDVSMRYQEEGKDLVVIAGKEYGTGSSRDWAAKGTQLLGVKAVIAESYERIHRSNLIGMGVLPLEFVDGDSADSLGLDGTETFDISGLESMVPKGMVDLTIHKDGKEIRKKLKVRLDTAGEFEYFRHGGILTLVLRELMG